MTGGVAEEKRRIKDKKLNLSCQVVIRMSRWVNLSSAYGKLCF